MKKNNLKKIAPSVILLTILTFSNVALASEVTGTLSTGLNSSLGNNLTGTVVVPPGPTDSGGRSGGSSGGTARLEGKIDINGDGRVDILDFIYLMANWNRTGSNILGDLNRDGKIDILDFVIMMANWTI